MSPRHGIATALVALGLLVTGCGSESSALEVFAAASLADLMDAAVGAWGGEARVHSAGSSTLVAQVRRGADADLLISADRLSLQGLQTASMWSEPTPLWRNELAVVTPVGSGGDLQAPADLAAVDCLALADPALAPAGRYARDALVEGGLWKALRKRATGASHVRAALAQVAGGVCEAGIVYRTDAAASPSVRIAFLLPSPRPVVYWGLVLAENDRGERARDLLGFLRGPEGRALARSYGLEPLEAGP